MSASPLPAETIQRRFFRLTPLGLSKHAQLRESIIGAVDDGELRLGDKLPPEKALGNLLNISLGTTQKALATLASAGYLVREHGVGTFVGQPRRSIQGSWHYRFTNPASGEHVPVYTRLLARAIVGDGPWTAVLGADERGYVRIDRRISIGDREACLSELYLQASLFGAIMELPAKRLENVNLKEIFEIEFGYPTIEAKGGARVVPLDDASADLMGVARGSWGLSINIVACSKGLRPISYQRMLVPPSDYELDMDFIRSP